MLTRRLGLMSSILPWRPVRHWRRNSRHPRPRGRRAGAPYQGPQRHRQPGGTPLGPVDTVARWAYVTDFDTGATLLEKQADEEMPPSSMTKLMTMYIVYSRLKEGRLKLEDELPVSEKAWRTKVRRCSCRSALR